MKGKVLYVSYDGMTDPLGQSQVLPYICGLTKLGYEFTLLSSEKPERFKENADKIKEICGSYGIEWVPLTFHTSPKLLSKAYDVWALKRKAKELQKATNFQLVHCRSYVGVDVGLFLKRKFGIKVLFDMRGFWVDERVDGNMWDLSNPIYKLAYRYYKTREGKYISDSDHIVSLTEAGRREIMKWKAYNGTAITVIPCSADFDLFTLTSSHQKILARKALGLPEKGLVLSYLGSIGSWYLLPEMLQLFKQTKIKYPGAKFLFITSGNAESIKNEAQKQGVSHEDLVIRFATRQEVNFLTKAGDINICFIKQAYSKIASSPTKLGEVFAMGIPVICNDGVGDVREIVESVNGGLVISGFSNHEYMEAIQKFDQLLELDSEKIRTNAFRYYNLRTAIENYARIYKSLF